MKLPFDQTQIYRHSLEVYPNRLRCYGTYTDVRMALLESGFAIGEPVEERDPLGVGVLQIYALSFAGVEVGHILRLRNQWDAVATLHDKEKAS